MNKPSNDSDDQDATFRRLKRSTFEEIEAFFHGRFVQAPSFLAVADESDYEQFNWTKEEYLVELKKRIDQFIGRPRIE